MAKICLLIMIASGVLCTISLIVAGVTTILNTKISRRISTVFCVLTVVSITIFFLTTFTLLTYFVLEVI